MALADKGVEFPVAEALTALDDGRALVDGGAVGKLAAAVVGAIALLAGLLAAQVAVQVAATALVLQHVLVDPFVADGQASLLRQPEADLLGAPVLAQQPLHQTPVLVGDTWLGLGMAAIHRQLMGLPGPVTFQATVAPQLPADRGLVDADDGGDL